MRPWTTRTLQAAAVAAGFAALGSDPASATETADARMPDLAQTLDLARIPDKLGATAPVDACRTQGNLAATSPKTPCADAKLTAQSPNPVKQAGSGIVRASQGITGELQDGPPLASGKTSRVLGQATAEKPQLEKLTQHRPSLGVNVRPSHTGVLQERTSTARSLDTEVNPRRPDHQKAFSADTAMRLNAAHDYTIKPVESPVGAVVPAPRSNPAQVRENPLSVKPQLSNVVPAAKPLPVLADLDSAVPAAAGKGAAGPTKGLM